MIVAVSAVIIFIVSFLLAIREASKELRVPPDIEKIRIIKKKSLSGVIIFLKEKIIHYSSHSS